MAALHLTVAVETWPLRTAFIIARGAKTEAHVVVATLTDGQHAGRGECVPYARYGETVEGVAETIRDFDVPRSREDVQLRLPPGAARNALDCALWDLAAKKSGHPSAETAGLAHLKPLETCFTLSLGAPEEMARAARDVPDLKLLKLKLGGDGDDARMKAVRMARPDARLVADANEAWTPGVLDDFLAAAAEARIELIEQPLPAAMDEVLRGRPRPVSVCADESVHTTGDLARLTGCYDAINVKLDKAGGLTEALAMHRQARAAGLKIMVGCMVATSLAMAPAFLVAQDADWVDLDGPLLLARDRQPGLSFRGGIIDPPDRALWG